MAGFLLYFMMLSEKFIFQCSGQPRSRQYFQVVLCSDSFFLLDIDVSRVIELLK